MAMQQAILKFSVHVEDENVNEYEQGILKLMMNEDFVDELVEIQQFFLSIA